ncbi:hypothetical protein ACN20G_21020 [Streptomyces sp. BI20]|uniref:hypothetical protein n=1 Tax=Streptomyces sp. BI20 TaxID=3403460 RepID=UPI003C769C0E
MSDEAPDLPDPAAGAAGPARWFGPDEAAPAPGPEALPDLLRTGPFHLALRAALTARGLPLHRVRHRLAERGIGVGVTSLSYWQQGARRPSRPESLRAVAALEEVLELPSGALSRLLDPDGPEPDGPEPPRGPVRPAARPYRELVSVGAAVERLLTELEVPLDGGLHTVGHHERVRMGPRRELAGRDSQQVVRAHREGVDRYLAIHHGDPGCDPAGVRVRAYENCRAGRVRRHAETGIVVAELLFDTRLRVGDTYLFGYGFEDGTGGPGHEYVRGFGFPGGQYVLQVRFDAAALPVRCRRFRRRGPQAPRTGVAELTATGGHRVVHLVEPVVRRGILGIDWEWE